MTKKWSKRNCCRGRRSPHPAAASHASQSPGRVSVDSNTVFSRSAGRRGLFFASSVGLAMTVLVSANSGITSNCVWSPGARRIDRSKPPWNIGSLLRAVDTRTSVPGWRSRNAARRGISHRMANVAGALMRITLLVAARP
ncbi:hypothetical protein D9M72_515310 [compost metagenome]